MNCTLCGEPELDDFYTDNWRQYQRCDSCDLIQVPTSFHLDSKSERAHYDTHNNSPDDADYRAFLNRLVEPLQKQLTPDARGLDFGCGPGLTISVMYRELGHVVDNYDIYYAKNESIWQQEFDFVTASEVVEHLKKPGRTLSRLWGLIRSGGKLGIMTQTFNPTIDFGTWHYRRDPTHICFFSQHTMQWLADYLQAEQLREVDSNVFIFSK
jgi:hypothetical protein